MQSDIARKIAGLKLRSSHVTVGVHDHTVRLEGFVDGAVHDGILTLTGAVTDPDKSSEVTERLEKIMGLQEIKGGIRVLPVSLLDDRIRVAIATQMYSDTLFVNYSRSTPPVRVIVDNGHVTLVGIVASEIERRKAEAIARMVPGVFSVDDHIRLASEVPR